uniref:Uncharacterized protein n=1 Tax=Anguilla anguilla TaxID=7936 RepID=A0A0E9TC54_ANGAN
MEGQIILLRHTVYNSFFTADQVSGLGKRRLCISVRKRIQILQKPTILGLNKARHLLMIF